MGFIEVDVEVAHTSEPAKSVSSRVLVDTGAILSAFPLKVLLDLGIKPLGKRPLRVFGGQAIEREIGVAVIRYKEFSAGASVIFAEENDTPVLGATALESLGLQVDPVSKELKPVGLLMLNLRT